MTRTCTDCGSADVIAIAPGSEPERVGDSFVVERGVQEQAWCAACWARKFGRKA